MDVQVSHFVPKDFWNQKYVNSYGEEVQVARSVRWENIDESLPKAELTGIVPAADLCTGGMKDFIMNPQKWLKPEKDRTWMKSPRVMVPPDDWDRMVEGLLDRNLCGVLPLSDVFCVDQKPILGGLFGVPKGETKANGTDILRLIMDLRGINQVFLSLGGDLSTLPVMSQLFQLQLHPHEQLTISSEDIRSMFYIIGLPPCWAPYLCFGRVVPSRFNPPNVTSPCVLYSKVLPMGYVNSVSLAQAIHRTIVGDAMKGAITTDHEVRRDRPFPKCQVYYRTYLDNFDQLSKRSQGIISSGEPSLVELLQKEYKKLGVPRNEKKAVKDSLLAELQGAWIDGDKGLAYAKPDKASKYLLGILDVLRQGRASQKQLQILAGGLVYLFQYRRPLMATLNSIWEFIVQFESDRMTRPLPRAVKDELVAAFFLAGVSYIDFRLLVNPTITASDASEFGGGLCKTHGLTNRGLAAAKGLVRGEKNESEPPHGLLVISCFDGIAALRVALDNLSCPVSGYISIECSEAASRVVEASFPTADRISDIREVVEADLLIWAAKYPNSCGVLVAGGPPCQGVSGLNASKKGALADPRSSLYLVFCQIIAWARSVFTWCPVFSLMESVASMSPEDRSHYSKGINLLPYLVDSKTVSLCKRPRLWWFDWVVQEREDVTVFNPTTTDPCDYGKIIFTATVASKGLLIPGWTMACPEGHFNTFTTAQPKTQPGFKPAGLASCSATDLAKWREDRFRFPPYTYKYANGVCHRKKGWRPLLIQEKEVIMGFPKDFTLHASPKTVRKSQSTHADDVRMTLIGNSWNVAVVSLLLHDLLVSLKLISPISVQQIVDALRPGAAADLSGILFRPGLAARQPFAEIGATGEQELRLANNLCHLVSSKGSDILLNASTEPLPHADRFRTTIPASLWRWSTVCGWEWQNPTHQHINKLEIKAVYTGLKWRIARQHLRHTKIIHLVDSMVSLQILNKGRSSSRKLKVITRKICALLISSRLFLVLAYVNTGTNPADRPSRRPVKKKWVKGSK